MRAIGAVALMCLLGDATTNIGAFPKSLNLAALPDAGAITWVVRKVVPR